MAREDLHFRLRIPEELKARVAAAASDNHRSMTAEIITRLESTFTPPGEVSFNPNSALREALTNADMGLLNNERYLDIVRFILGLMIDSGVRINDTSLAMARKLLKDPPWLAKVGSDEPPTDRE